jgi:predicted nuclease of predicted toxin-antitoxin system
MALKLVLDQGLPRSAAGHLRDAGLDVVHVAEIGMSRALDADILAFGREHARVVVTFDADFHALLAHSGDSEPSVVRLRIEGLGGLEIASLIRTILDACSAELAAGAVVTAVPERIRLRRLPL